MDKVRSLLSNKKGAYFAHLDNLLNAVVCLLHIYNGGSEREKESEWVTEIQEDDLKHLIKNPGGTILVSKTICDVYLNA